MQNKQQNITKQNSTHTITNIQIKNNITNHYKKPHSPTIQKK